jgi:hypothetical protein
MRTSARVLSACLLGLMPFASCTCPLQTPTPEASELLSVDPPRGYAGADQPITIVGSGFAPEVTQDLGEAEGVKTDATFTATLGGTELRDVTFVDAETLTAVVPSGIDVGTHQLEVTTPFDETLTLAAAYSATASAAPELLLANPSDVVNDADTDVAVSGTSLSGAAMELVDADGNATALATADAQDDGVTVTIPAATAAGDYTVRATVEGLSADLVDALTVHEPAALSVTVTPSPTTVSEDDAFTLTVTVANDGATDATAVAPDTPTLGGAGSATLVSGPVPTSADIAVGESTSFTFNYTGDGAGDVTLALRARGTNQYSGREVVSDEVTSTPVLVEVPATLSASFTTPARVSIGQTFTISMDVTNDGESTATGVAPILQAPAGAGALTQVDGPTPATADLATGQSQTFTYNYTATSSGDVTITGRADGTDSVSLDTVTSGDVTTNAITVEDAASLTATWTAQGFATVNQMLQVTLDVANGGAAAAVDVTPDTPQVIVSGGAAAIAGAPPAAQTIPGGESRTFNFTYTVGPNTGSIVLSTAARGDDANSGLEVASPTASSDPIIVQQPAALAATLQVQDTLSAGQDFAVVMEVTNSGQATAANVQPNALIIDNGGTGASATLTSAPAPQSINSGITATFTYVYTAGAGLGTLNFTGDAAGADANSGLPVTTPQAAAGPVTVEAGPDLVVTYQVPQFVSVGQVFNVRVDVTNNGDADAVTVAPQSAPALNNGALATLATGPVPTDATVAGGGGSASFSYTYTAEAEGTLNFTVAASGVDENDPQTTVTSPNATSDDVTIQPAPDLQVVSITAPATVSEGQAFTVSMLVRNNGGVLLEGVLPGALTQTPAASATEDAAPQAGDAQDVAANGGEATFNWTYTAGTAGTFKLTGDAAGTDANSQNTVTAPAIDSNDVLIQTPPALVLTWTTPVTLSYDDGFDVTLNVANTGEATANDVAPTGFTINGATAINCGAAAPASQTLAGGANQDFVYSCTAGTTSGVASFTAGASGTDANDPTDATVVTAGDLTSNDVTIQSPPVLVPTWAFTLPASGDVSYNQVFTATLSVENQGEAAADVTAVDVTVNGGTGTTCGAANPATAQIAGVATQDFVFTCTAGTTSGTVSVTSSVTAEDANNAADVSPADVTDGAIDVESPVELVAVFETLPVARAAFADNFTAQLTVTNNGEADAVNVIGPGSLTTNNGSNVTCTRQQAAQTVAGGASFTFDYDCGGGDTSVVENFTGNATGDDENTGVTDTAADATSDDVIIGSVASLTVGVVTTPGGTLYRKQTFRTTVTVTNNGEAVADNTSVTLSFDNGTFAIADVTVPTQIAGETTETFEFDVTVDPASATGAVNVDATAAGEDIHDATDAGDADGANTPDSFTLAINTPPVACFVISNTRTARATDDAFTFDAGCTTDAEGQALTYNWDWGDGNTTAAGGATPSFSYTGAGTWEVVLTVSDGIDSHTYSTWVATAVADDYILIDNTNDGNFEALTEGNANHLFAFNEADFNAGNPVTLTTNEWNPAAGVRVFGHAGIFVDAGRGVDLDAGDNVLAFLDITGADAGGAVNGCVVVSTQNNQLIGNTIHDCDGGTEPAIRLSAANNTVGPDNRLTGGFEQAVLASASNQIIQSNTITGCSLRCVEADNGSDGHLIELNVIYAGTQSGIRAQNGSTGLQIFHNTVDENGGYGVRIDAGADAVVTNNLLTNNTNLGICEAGTVTATFNGFDGNTNDPNGCGYTPDVGNDDVIADPLYTDQGNRDYTLQVTSPAIDEGDPNVPTDTTAGGAARYNNDAPDLGAHETNRS